MIKCETRTITQSVPVGFICDICKTEFNDSMDWQEFHHIRFTAGYNSAFVDGDRVMCDICSKCLKELIGDFCRYEEER